MTTELSVRVRPSSTQLLARVLEMPALAEELRALPAAALGKLVEHVGLEDAGELVALATTEQLCSIFDEDLWRNRAPGEEERFDDARFVLWLEALLEAGERLVAERLSELPEDLLLVAFNRRLLVLTLDQLRVELDPDAADADAAEKALSNCLSEEFDEFVVVARTPEGWDSVLAALLALDREHHDLLTRLLERCCDASSSYIDDNGGLYEVLSSEQLLENDARAERDDRRAAAGFVAPREAKAFLQLARSPAETPYDQRDPLTRAYFRDVERTSAAQKPVPAPSERPRRDLVALLQTAGVSAAAAQRLLPAANESGSGTTELAFVRAMRSLRERDARCFAERSEELAYLANVLVASATYEGRRVRPIEAVRAALVLVSKGLEALTGGGDAADPRETQLDVLRSHPADGLFRAGVHASSLRWPGGIPDIAGLV